MQQSKEKLIEKLFLDQCSRQELEYLFQLLQESPSEAGPEVLTKLFAQLEQIPKLEASTSSRIFQMVEEGIDFNSSNKTKPNGLSALNTNSFYKILSIAAAVLLLVTCTFWALQNLWNDQEVVQQTAYNVVKEFTLPDGSLVVLNGNSSLRYPKQWEEAQTRIVYLDGEAYFKVEQQPATQAKFQVITNDLTVEVLGTTFNVNTRRDETRVFLEEGKVLVNLDHNAEQIVELNPGEGMQYSKTRQALTEPQKIAQEVATSWRKGTLQFREVPLQLILDELSQAHKLEFSIIDEDLAETKFTLTLPTEDMEATMDILSRTIGVSIHKDLKKFIIEKDRRENK